MRMDLGQFLDYKVYPALWNRLDSAFPEFGFVQKENLWEATNEETSRQLVGSPPPDRIWCCQNFSFGFVIQGGEFVRWVDYVVGKKAEGSAFVEAVRILSEKAGIPLPELDLSIDVIEALEKIDRHSALFETFFSMARENLMSEEGRPAREYLASRGFSLDQMKKFGFGLYPESRANVREFLASKGFSDEEVSDSGLISSNLWAGRLVGPWRGRGGRIINIWARTMQHEEQGETKYLMLKGGTKGAPFGLHEARGKERVVVEGVMDCLSLRAQGIPNVIALGGDRIGDQQVRSLLKVGVSTVTLNFDHDPENEAGRSGTLHTIKKLGQSGIRAYVVDPADMVDKDPKIKVDPDLFVRQQGREAYENLIEKASRGSLFMAAEIIDRHDLETDKGRDAAIEELLELDSQLTEPVEREDLWQEAADRMGYPLATLQKWAADQREKVLEKERNRVAENDLSLIIENARDQLQAERSPIRDIMSELSASLNAVQGRLTEDTSGLFLVESVLERVKVMTGGKTSGWNAVDSMDVRFHPGELAVIGARTGHCKTTALISILLHWLKTYPDEQFIFVSHEVPIEAFTLKVLSTLTRLLGGPGQGWSFYEVRDYVQDARDEYPSPPALLDQAKETLQEWESRLKVVCIPDWTVENIAGYARRGHDSKGPVGGVLVDYLQLIYPPSGSYDRRDIEVSMVARRLKGISVDISCPVVTAAQINRQAIAQAGPIPSGGFDSPKVQEAIRARRPQLHHLREGGSEQEADLVLGLLNYRADYIEAAEGGNVGDTSGPLDVSVLKSRYGGLGLATLRFEARTGTILDPTGDEG